MNVTHIMLYGFQRSPFPLNDEEVRIAPHYFYTLANGNQISKRDISTINNGNIHFRNPNPMINIPQNNNFIDNSTIPNIINYGTTTYTNENPQSFIANDTEVATQTLLQILQSNPLLSSSQSYPMLFIEDYLERLQWKPEKT